MLSAGGRVSGERRPASLPRALIVDDDRDVLRGFARNLKNRISVSLLVLVVTALSGLATGVAQAQEGALPGLQAVLGELRKGGFVVYFRHATTDHAGASDEEANLASCETQRNLSAVGREQASRIGQAFRDLGIPVGTVTTSPFCRCKDTARLAFGRFTVSDDLNFAMGADGEERKRLAEALRRMLSSPPGPGTNAVIVAHTANLRESAGIWPKPEGVAYLFRPRPGGELAPAAKVLPEEWAAAADRERQGARGVVHVRRPDTPLRRSGP